jgi:hypothetical protein
MRTILAILASITLLSAKAQSHLPVFPWGLGYSQWQPMPFYAGPNNAIGAQKWQLRPSAGLSAGYIFFNGGISYLSAPFSLNLYHPLTSNVTAFAGVSLTPAVFSMGNGYFTPFQNPAYSNRYGLTINPAVQGGLIYTNDAHTFSVSGSVWMQQGSYPIYPAQRATYPKQQ